MYWFLSCPTWILSQRTISNSFRTAIVHVYTSVGHSTTKVKQNVNLFTEQQQEQEPEPQKTEQMEGMIQ